MNLMTDYKPMDELLATLKGSVSLYIANIQNKCDSLMAGLIGTNIAAATIPTAESAQKGGRE